MAERSVSIQTAPIEATIKQEVETSETIAMPNIPNSESSSRPKKRKISRLTAPRKSAPSEATGGDSEMESATVNEAEAPSSSGNYASDSKVYEKYCVGFAKGGSKEALKQIQGMKSCLWFKPPGIPAYKFDLEKTLTQIGKKLWKAAGYNSPQSNPHRGQIFEILKRISVTWSNEFETTFKINGRSNSTHDQLRLMTRILLILPNGYEFWYIKDFEKAPGF